MLKRAYEIQDQLVNWRRDFHMHPELGFQETRTAAKAAEVLGGLGWRVRTGVGRTGVTADLGEGSPCVAIRADMDALPIQEQNPGISYASQHPGMMHACGHDAHTAIALGVATLLKGQEFPGRVRLLLQPSEEIGDDEGVSGAPRMIEDGAMEGVDMVLALHVDSHTPVGTIQVASGPASGGVDAFFATIRGKGAHGAQPHESVDPFVISAHVIMAINAIASRRLDPVAPAVVSIGSLHGGQATNVIPEAVELSGTLRFMDPEVQKQIHTEIERALEVARALGGDYELEFEPGGLPMINDSGVVKLIREVGADLLGAEHVQTPRVEMGAEDFGAFSDLAPGAMFMLGCQIEGDQRRFHDPHFDINERCLPMGAAILAEAALRSLRK